MYIHIYTYGIKIYSPPVNYNSSNRWNFNGVEARPPCITIAIPPSLAFSLSWWQTTYFKVLESSNEGLQLIWPEL